MSKIILYLVSDSTGDTVLNVARASLAVFENIEVEEHVFSFIRSDKDMEKMLEKFRQNPGIVMYTIIDQKLREKLKYECKQAQMLCIGVLSKVIADLSSYFEVKAQTGANIVGKQHELDNEYFTRMDAINFAISHDDGQSQWNLREADIILVGPSRTSKSPTSLYLSFKGYKTANIPYILNSPLPAILFEENPPLIIGLTINIDNLIQIRKNRLLSLYEDYNSCYVEESMVEKEIKESQKLFYQQNWPIIDVTKRSVEETAASIIQQYNIKHTR